MVIRGRVSCYVVFHVVVKVLVSAFRASVDIAPRNRHRPERLKLKTWSSRRLVDCCTGGSVADVYM